MRDTRAFIQRYSFEVTWNKTWMSRSGGIPIRSHTLCPPGLMAFLNFGIFHTPHMHARDLDLDLTFSVVVSIFVMGLGRQPLDGTKIKPHLLLLTNAMKRCNLSHDNGFVRARVTSS